MVRYLLVNIDDDGGQTRAGDDVENGTRLTVNENARPNLRTIRLTLMALNKPDTFHLHNNTLLGRSHDGDGKKKNIVGSTMLPQLVCQSESSPE